MDTGSIFGSSFSFDEKNILLSSNETGIYNAFAKAVTTNNSDMFLYDRKTDEMKHLSPHEGDVQYSPETFSPDSKSLYYRFISHLVDKSLNNF